ncbi:hypothetical protein Btru_030609 [Bulinus truncatus]|nr:hypothetical protein Btru_030609 [Bulinus truncatus]
MPHTPSVGSLSQDEIGIRDRLSDVSIDHSEVISEVTSVSLNSLKPVLMTPEAFTTSSSRGNIHVNGGTQLSLSSTSSFTNVTAINEEISSLHSPHGSIEQALLLPSSTDVTQTPSKQISY